jgi:type II secretory pathway component PulM
MPIVLETALVLALVALMAFLVPLLAQMRRTARSADQFLRAAQADLAQVAQDVHAVRLRLDQAALSLEPTLEALATLSRAAEGVGKAVTDIKARYAHGLESASQILGILMGGVRALAAFLPTCHKPQQPN